MMLSEVFCFQLKVCGGFFLYPSSFAFSILLILFGICIVPLSAGSQLWRSKPSLECLVPQALTLHV